MNIYTIYRATNIINGNCYIGFDSHWPNRRNWHKCYYKKKDNKFYRAIRKHDWDSFVFEPIYQSLDGIHTLKVMENYFITEHNSFKKGYNSTTGGEGTPGLLVTDETIQKRLSSDGYKNRNKNRIYSSGSDHPMYGKENKSAKLRMNGDDNPGKKQKNKDKYKQLYTGSGSPVYDHTIYTFINTHTNEVVSMTQYELRMKYNLSSGSLSRVVRKEPRYKSVKGWKLLT
jgi:group I intron endonuclease